MEKERNFKILMATGIEALDTGMGTVPNCTVAGICKNRNSLYDDVEKTSPQIVIASDWLPGEGEMGYLLRDIKNRYSFVRPIYLAGSVDPRDKDRIDELGKLVLSGIYDICVSNDINLEVVEDMIKHPKRESSVSYLAKNLLDSSDSTFVKNDFMDELPDSENLVPGIMDNVYVFTSIKPGTGKSFLSVNTACAIAAYGKKNSRGESPKVALIEADLQTLSIGTILNIKEDKSKNMKAAMEAVSNIFDGGNLIGDESDTMLVNKIIRDCMVPYSKLRNLWVLTGSVLTPEEVESLRISPEYYVYLLDVLKDDYDVIIVDTNSSIFHVTTYPILQKAKKCFYVINLDINNIQNNLRYYSTLKNIGIADKIKWVLNEDVDPKVKSKDNGTDKEKLEFTADEFEEQYFKLSARIPVIPKSVFLNRVYDGTPVVLDENVSYTKKVKEALKELAELIWPLEEEAPKRSGFSFFSKKEKAPKEKPVKEKKGKKKKKDKEEEDSDDDD